VDHPSEEILKRFASCAASRLEGRAVVAHLLKGCAVCAGKLKSWMEPAAVPASAYEDALSRFDRGLLETLEESIKPVEKLRGLPGEGSHSSDSSLSRGERGT
jgi:hypothetical protein